jgi:hypothetical protein
MNLTPRPNGDVLVISDLPRTGVQPCDHPSREHYRTNEYRSMLQRSDAVAYLGLN